jgi:hypothetical protein
MSARFKEEWSLEREGNAMPTFMTQSTFDMLTDAWRQLAANPVPRSIGPSYIFVPWAGEQLVAKARGIYYIGIATDAESGNGEQNFEVALRGTENFCRHPTRRHAPFWRFLDRLTREILNGKYDQTQDSWGWSNLLKVAGSAGPPHDWPPVLIESQRPACIAALQEEIARLRDSLIVVTSEKEYGILMHLSLRKIGGINHRGKARLTSCTILSREILMCTAIIRTTCPARVSLKQRSQK